MYKNSWPEIIRWSCHSTDTQNIYKLTLDYLPFAGLTKLEDCERMNVPTYAH